MLNSWVSELEIYTYCEFTVPVAKCAIDHVFFKSKEKEKWDGPNLLSFKKSNESKRRMIAHIKTNKRYNFARFSTNFRSEEIGEHFPIDIRAGRKGYQVAHSQGWGENFQLLQLHNSSHVSKFSNIYLPKVTISLHSYRIRIAT